MIFRLINSIATEPAFNVLRTQEQLGYVVSLSEWLGTEYMGLRVVVQSERDTKYVESRIEAFYTQMTGVLEKMNDAQFEEHKKGLTHEWNKKLKSLREEYGRFYEAIQSGYLDFSRGMLKTDNGAKFTFAYGMLTQCFCFVLKMTLFTCINMHITR